MRIAGYKIHIDAIITGLFLLADENKNLYELFMYMYIFYYISMYTYHETYIQILNALQCIDIYITTQFLHFTF